MLGGCPVQNRGPEQAILQRLQGQGARHNPGMSSVRPTERAGLPGQFRFAMSPFFSKESRKACHGISLIGIIACLTSESSVDQLGEPDGALNGQELLTKAFQTIAVPHEACFVKPSFDTSFQKQTRRLTQFSCNKRKIKKKKKNLPGLKSSFLSSKHFESVLLCEGSNAMNSVHGKCSAPGPALQGN